MKENSLTSEILKLIGEPKEIDENGFPKRKIKELLLYLDSTDISTIIADVTEIVKNDQVLCGYDLIKYTVAIPDNLDESYLPLMEERIIKNKGPSIIDLTVDYDYENKVYV